MTIITPIKNTMHSGVFGDLYPVKCETCGEENLHHEIVVVTERHEDAETGTQVLVCGDNIEVNRDLRYHNPSTRRTGVAIACSCEHCDGRTLILVEQHKGTTYIRFERETWPLDKPELKPRNQRHFVTK